MYHIELIFFPPNVPWGTAQDQMRDVPSAPCLFPYSFKYKRPCYKDTTTTTPARKRIGNVWLPFCCWFVSFPTVMLRCGWFVVSFLVWLLRCFYLLVGPKWMKKPEACLASLIEIRFQVNTERIGSKREQKWAPLLIVFKRNRKKFACRLLNV